MPRPDLKCHGQETMRIDARLLLIALALAVLPAIAAAQVAPTAAEVAAYRGLLAAAAKGDEALAAKRIAAGANVNQRDS